MITEQHLSLGIHKNIILFGIASIMMVFLFSLISAPSIGPNIAFNMTNVAGTGATAWTNPQFGNTSGINFANASLAALGKSQRLMATNFSFSIPSNANITGVVVNYQVRASGIDIGEDADGIKLVKSGAPAGNTEGSGVWPLTLTNLTRGNSTDLWGTTLVPSDINSTFGFEIVVHDNNGATAEIGSVNNIIMTIYYIIPTCSPLLNQNWIISDNQTCSGVNMTIGNGTIIITPTGNLTISNGANMTANGLNMTGPGDKVFILKNSQLKLT